MTIRAFLGRHDQAVYFTVCGLGTAIDLWVLYALGKALIGALR